MSMDHTAATKATLASQDLRRMSELRVLVVIANHGTKNDEYLHRILSEYRRLQYNVRIVVLSNLSKNLGSDVEVVVGCPTRDPWSLPFGHKRIFCERQDQFDLFIYTEDDMLITESNIKAFLRIGSALREDEIVGLFQYENFPDGKVFYPAVHSHFRLLPNSVRKSKEFIFGRFTNLHSACYILTRHQLKRAIASGGFMVKPHQSQYDMLVTAATDPYTQCGFTKYICLSHFDELLVAHLPNKYAGTRLGMEASVFSTQMRRLLELQEDVAPTADLVEPMTSLFHNKWSKDYYEPARQDLISLLPDNSKHILSIGCGWGETEAALKKAGASVVGAPMDRVIGACLESHGVETVYGSIDAVVARLAGRRFDAVLVTGVLHLAPQPDEVVRAIAGILAPGAMVIANFPNVDRLPSVWERLRHPKRYRGFGDFRRSGMHRLRRRQVMSWFKASGLKVTKVVETGAREVRVFNTDLTWKLLKLLSRETVIVAQDSMCVTVR